VSAAYDRDRLVELFGDDPGTLAEIEREFFETARDAAQEIAATDDLAAIARAAHRLKGAAGMIGAMPLHQIAEWVERAAKAHDLVTVRRIQGQFCREVLRVAEQAALLPGGVCPEASHFQEPAIIAGRGSDTIR
jgi:HPt (histidine-containing phosphotransfer) domain-containing protein